jgi:hypothetical protein
MDRVRERNFLLIGVAEGDSLKHWDLKELEREGESTEKRKMCLLKTKSRLCPDILIQTYPVWVHCSWWFLPKSLLLIRGKIRKIVNQCHRAYRKRNNFGSNSFYNLCSRAFKLKIIYGQFKWTPSFKDLWLIQILISIIISNSSRNTLCLQIKENKP